MDYTYFPKDMGQVAHLRERLFKLEQQHYATSVNVELAKRLGQTDSDLYKQETEKLADYENVHAEVTKMLAELEAQIAAETPAPTEPPTTE